MALKGKCPPGVICIENVSLIILFIFIIILGVIFFNAFGIKNIQNYQVQQSQTQSQTQSQYRQQNLHNNTSPTSPFYVSPNYILSNNTNEPLLNPFSPPLKQNHFYPNTKIDPVYSISNNSTLSVPINQSTSHHDIHYTQVGILTRKEGKETIVPIFGRPLHSNRNKWQYYTTTDGNHMIKLPVNKGGRSCTSDIGCDEIYNGDSIYIEGYKDIFNATIYENNAPKYIPLSL